MAKKKLTDEEVLDRMNQIERLVRTVVEGVSKGELTKRNIPYIVKSYKTMFDIHLKDQYKDDCKYKKSIEDSLLLMKIFEEIEDEEWKSYKRG